MAFDSANTTGRTVVGLFRNRADAEQAISNLKDAGFTRDQVGIAIRDRGEQRELADTTDTTPAKGAAAGAVTGGLVGGIIGLLGSLLVPGLGPIVVGGVLESVLVGAGAGAATGGIIGALVGLGVPEADARHFDAGFREGGTLVTVDAGVRVNDAERILGSCNADLGPTWASRSASAPVSAGETAAAQPMRRAKDKVREAAYNGSERRRFQDPAYAGPERRLVGV